MERHSYQNKFMKVDGLLVCSNLLLLLVVAIVNNQKSRLILVNMEVLI